MTEVALASWFLVDVEGELTAARSGHCGPFNDHAPRPVKNKLITIQFK